MRELELEVEIYTHNTYYRLKNNLIFIDTALWTCIIWRKKMYSYGATKYETNYLR